MKISCRKKAEETLKNFAYYSMTEIIKNAAQKKLKIRSFRNRMLKQRTER